MARAQKPEMPQKLHLVRDVLDKLLVDRNHEPLGRADRIVLVMQDDGAARVARLEIGSPGLAQRLSIPAISLATLRILGASNHPPSHRVPAKMLDLTDPKHPRLRGRVHELEQLNP